MNASPDWLDFAPPKAKGMGRSFALAIVAHLVLVAALTLGVQWKRDAPVTTVEAELWSAMPKAAAPKLVEAAPPPPPTPTPAAKPPPPAPVVKTPDADIALEREKQKQLEQEKRLAAEKLAQQKLAQEKLEEAKLAKDKREQEKNVALEKKRQQDLNLAQDKKAQEEEAKRREDEDKKRALASKAKQDALKAQQQVALEKQESIKLEILRKDNLQRMAGLAGATGGAASAGTALRASGPSSSYSNRISAIIKANIVFIDDTPDNPVAEVEVRVAPDGTILKDKIKLIKSSGNKAWDEAVLKAIDKTAVLPRDTDGTVQPLLVINFRRRD